MTKIDDYNQRLRATINSGEWWNSPWWEEECFLSYCHYTKEEVAKSFETLRKIYDKRWFTNERDYVLNTALPWIEHNSDRIKRDPMGSIFYDSVEKATDYYEKFYAVAPFGFRAQHSVFNCLIHPGTYPLTLLIMLGRDIVVAEKANLIGDLYRRLRNADQFSGAYFELEILARLYRCDFVVKRPQNVDSKQYDFEVIKDNEVIFLELKRLEPAQLNKALSELSYAMLEEVTLDPNISRIRLTLELSKDVSERNIYDIRANWQSMACEIKKAILDKISKNEWGTHKIQGLAHFMIIPKDETRMGSSGELSGLSLSLEAETKKIISNAIEEAVVQLPRGQPGLLILDPPYTIMLNNLVYALSEEHTEWQEYKHLSGVMLFDSHFRTDKICYDVRFIENQKTDFNISNYAVIKTLCDLETESGGHHDF